MAPIKKTIRVALFGRDKAKIAPLIRDLKFQLVTKNPQYVISFGGDGTLMRAENLWPSVPKILIKNSQICKLCSSLPKEDILKRVASGQFILKEIKKLQVSAMGQTMYAMNDIVVHNSDSRHAMRYEVWIDGSKVGDTIIGDGVVLATPLGSTGYYRSITDSFFELGIGLAFNNSTEQSDHIVLKEHRTIKIRVLRGPASVYADNHQKEIMVDIGDEVEIKMSDRRAYIVVPN